MPGLKDVPGTHTHRVHLPAMAAAGTADEFAVFVAPGNLKVVGVNWAPDAAVVANVTNYTTINVVDRGANGAGAAVVASRAYSAGNSTAFVAEAPALSGTAANLLLAAGDVITAQRAVTGTGLLLPAGVLEINCQYR